MHTFNGFHDNTAVNRYTNQCIVLKVERIDRPPVPGDKALVCVQNWDGSEAEQVGETDAWNFPQGSRQHWVSEQSIVYNRSDSGSWIGVKLNLKDRSELILEKPVYAVNLALNAGYGINYARLHRLGGYGFVGIEDHTASNFAPENDGIWNIDLTTGKAQLMLSLKAISAAQGITPVPQHTHHYVTHLSFSPDSSRLAFLHRFWLSDGGIQTRLMYADPDGSNLQCLLEGFLSHYDWTDENRIFIWARKNSVLQRGRSHWIFHLPGIKQSVPVIKPIVKAILGKKIKSGSTFKIVSVVDKAYADFGEELFAGDGHPSYRPTDRRTILVDNYPDKAGWRRLMLCPVSKPKIIELGRYQQLQAEPDSSQLAKATLGVDPLVLKAFTEKHFAYSRSGIHCDLHPHWRWDGKEVRFDSNHEGHRDVYTINVENILDRDNG